MSDQNRLREVAPILRAYSIEPYFVEDFGKIKKIYSNKGVFALKKIPPASGTDFIRHVQFLYQKGYNRIVPIYPALDGRYAILYQNQLYYLMPWMPNEERENQSERHKQLFRELARIHILSSREITIHKEERKEHFENTLLEWEKEKEFIEGFMETSERKWYMSPFELMFCLYYHEVSQALSFSKRKLEDWYEKTKDQEKARSVLVHGKVSTDHFLFDERGYGYFINFERSKPGSPFHDLLPFVSRSLKSFPKQPEDCVDWVYTYFKYFPLKEDEMLLFLAYLAHPGQIIRTAETYFKKQAGKNERKLVQQLQRHYWQFKNTEYVVMRIEEIEQRKKEAEEKAQD
jgi:spore coat protein YsxE